MLLLAQLPTEIIVCDFQKFVSPYYCTNNCFNADVDLSGRDTGRSIQQLTKSQHFKAQISLTYAFLVSVADHILLKGKGFPYSLPSVGPGAADPGVQASDCL